MSLFREAQQCLANRIAHKNLNAFIKLTDDAFLSRAAQLADSSSEGALRGRLIAIKDNINTKDLPTTAASASLRDFTSPYDATVVSLLRENGALISGKTNLDEFGMGSHSTFSHFGAVKQYGSEQVLSAGGSSGGSAVAVATQQCWAALGTDTGGSVRLPAAYTGTVGFKPSYGLISRWGVIAYANSLDTVGIIGRETKTVREVFDCVNRFDSSDPTSLSQRSRKKLREASENLSKLRIGVPIEYNVAELSPSIRDAWRRTLQALSRHGHTLHLVSLPTTRHALSAYYVLAPAEASSNLAKYDGVRYGNRAGTQQSGASEDGKSSHPHTLFAETRGRGFGEEVKRRILLGSFSLSADAIDNYFIQAQRVRRMAQQDFDQVFRQPNMLLQDVEEYATSNASKEAAVDVLICPTAPTTPPTLDSLQQLQPVEAFTNDVFTVPASLAGLPAVSIPVTPSVREAGSTCNNIGMQAICQYGFDGLALDVAALIEEVTKEAQN